MKGDRTSLRHGGLRPSNTLSARRLGVDTQHENVVFMRADSHVFRSEGFATHARVRLSHGERSVVATLYRVTSDLLRHEEAGLSDTTWHRLGLHDGDLVSVSHPAPLNSFGAVRGKVYGEPLGTQSALAIIQDIVARRYSDIHLSSYVTALSAQQLNHDEMVALTTAMVDTGDRLHWDHAPIVDKHCVGGLPGNRTTPIVVAIMTALGLTMPKTSSRAITSPSGTADTMETMAPVELDLASIRRVVESEGGCIVWGGAVELSPADDIIIHIERALDLDSPGPLVASVLSKKVAAGSTHLVLDIPVGPTAKIRTRQSAQFLSDSLIKVGNRFGMNIKVLMTDGYQPVGRGIGPALEARDVLAVLQGSPQAPIDLKQRALSLAGALLELAGSAQQGLGVGIAAEALSSGRAWTKFQRICDAQGGMREPPHSVHKRPVRASRDARIVTIDNRRLAQVAKLAGAPDAKAAGVELHVRLGDFIEAQQPLYTVHTETPGELAYAIDYVAENTDIIGLSS